MYRSDPNAEPVIDDAALEAEEEQATEELIVGLAEYARGLEQQIVQLRERINDLTPHKEALPFPELHMDLYETFDHYTAYARFAHVLQALE